MNRIWTVFLLASALHGADVTLWMAGQTLVSNSVRITASLQAARMFDAIGVRLDWRKQKPEAPDDAVAIEVRFTSGIPGRPGALAFSNPFDPVPVVTVMYDRILDGTDGAPQLRPAFLAHVLAHEIGHLLMRTTGHSPDGVMKAHWTNSDFQRMTFRPLPFLPDDADMIRRRLGLTSATH